MRLQSLRGTDVVRGMLIYPAGDTAAALLTGGFSPLRLAGMMVVGGFSTHGRYPPGSDG